ncbi:hypothetical protein D3C77_513310 [compost metagenome]
MGVIIFIEAAQNIDKFRSFNRVASDAYRRRLADAAGSQLVYRLVSKRSASGYYADMTRHMDVARHNTDFALSRRNDARAVRSDQYRLLSFHITGNLDHIEHRNTFRNADHKLHFGFYRFENRICGKCWRDINNACRCPGGLFRFLYGIEYRQADRFAVFQRNFYFRAAFARRGAAYHLRTVIQGAFRVEQSRFSGNALCNHFRIFIDQNTHRSSLL